MNAVIQGVLRHALTGVGGVLATNGYLSDAQVETAVGAIIALAGVGFSAYKNYKAKK